MEDLQKVYDEEYERWVKVYEKDWRKYQKEKENEDVEERTIFEAYIFKYFEDRFKIEKLGYENRRNEFLKDIWDCCGRSTFLEGEKVLIDKLWEKEVRKKYFNYKEYEIVEKSPDSFTYLPELTKRENELDLVKWIAHLKAWNYFRYNYVRNFDKPIQEKILEPLHFQSETDLSESKIEVMETTLRIPEPKGKQIDLKQAEVSLLIEYLIEENIIRNPKKSGIPIRDFMKAFQLLTGYSYKKLEQTISGEKKLNEKYERTTFSKLRRKLSKINELIISELKPK